jgi:hypothetical protein
VDSLLEKSSLYLQKFLTMDFNESYDLFKIFIQNMLLLALYKESSTNLVKKASKSSNEENEISNTDGAYQILLRTLSDFITGNKQNGSNKKENKRVFQFRKTISEMILSSLTDYSRFIPLNNSALASLVESTTKFYKEEFLSHSDNDERVEEESDLQEVDGKENNFSMKYRVSNKNNIVITSILV